MDDIAILIPAAGTATRMRGRDKLLEPVDGQPLLARMARAACAAGAPVLVTLPPGAAARRAALAGIGGLTLREVPEAAEGIAASIRTGARWAAETGAAGLMVLLADLPEIESADIAAVAAAFATAPDRVHRGADAAGRAGHPVIVPRRLFAAMDRLRGDAGARGIVAAEAPVLVPLPQERATTDLDTPEAWAAWRRRTGR